MGEALSRTIRPQPIPGGLIVDYDQGWDTSPGIARYVDPAPAIR